jgi:site-specific recombinase XerD
MEKIKLQELVITLERELYRLHYSAKTVTVHKRAWHRLIKFFNEKMESYFSLNLAMQYLDEKYDFFAKQESGTLNSGAKLCHRSISMLSEYQLHGMVNPRHRGNEKISVKEHYKELLAKFRSYCTFHYAYYTISGYGRSAKKLLFFIESKDVNISELNPVLMEEFVKTLLGYSPKMIEFTFSGIKCFMHFLHEEGYISENLSEQLPKVKVPQKARIPSIWEEETLEKLLLAVDRGGPTGKRDHAILLLASLLGMRSVDIRKMQFCDIDWEKRSIDIIQSKSKRSVSYPLLTSVGWAIIDYIKYGRPECECPEIFVSLKVPFRPLLSAACFDDIIKKYMKLAHIVAPRDRKYGIHSLRHTYATSLMEKHIPIEDIAQLMGHVNPNTTAIYLKSSLGLLRECPLTLDEE